MAITASIVPLVLEKTQGNWDDNQNQSDAIANVDTLTAIAANQTSKVDVIIENEKDRDVKLTWIKACPPEPDDATDSCTFAGEEVSTDSQVYSLGQYKETQFKINIDGFYDNEFQASDASAALLRAHMIGHAEQAAKYAVAKLNAFAGTNLYSNRGKWNISGTTTEIPEGMWDSSLFGALLRTAKKNKLLMPFLLSGELLDQEFFMYKTGVGNADGKGDEQRIRAMQTYFDLHNVDEVNEDEYCAYMIAKGALAIASKAYYTEQVVEIPGRDAHKRVKMKNPFADMLWSDIQITTQCSGGKTYEHWKIKTKYDIFRNPLGCVSGTTGILKFKQTPGV